MLPDLFKSLSLNKDDLFKSHKVKTSGLSKYHNIMTKQQAYSKLTRRNTRNIDALLDDRRAMINILERKQKKYPYRAGRYSTAISRLQAERDALQAEKDKNKKDQEDLIRFTTSYAGKVVPADAITAFVAGKVPLPYRLTAPEQVPNANPISAPELGGPIYQPTNLIQGGGEASGPLPSIGSGTPFQPSGTQAPVEEQTGQGSPQSVDSENEIVKQAAMQNAGLGVDYPSDVSQVSQVYGESYKPAIQRETDRLINEAEAKRSTVPQFLSSDSGFETEPETKEEKYQRLKQALLEHVPRRRKKKTKPEPVIIKQEDQQQESEPETEQEQEQQEIESESENEIQPAPKSSESSESSESSSGSVPPRMLNREMERRYLKVSKGLSSSSSSSDSEPKVRAKQIEKYLKAYKKDYLSREEYQQSSNRKGSYVKYLNGLIRKDPEFWNYHNVVKKK